MRRAVSAALLLSAVLALCACGMPPASAVHVVWRTVGGSHVSTGGVDLSLGLREHPASPRGVRVEAVYTVGGTSATPLALSTPGGVEAVIRAVSSSDGSVAFDSTKTSKDALAQVPVASRPGDTETLDDAGRLESTYLFTLPAQGRYLVSVSTLGPKVTTPPVTVVVP